MIHTITFNLNADNENYADEQHELNQMMHSKNAFLAINKFDNYLREMQKWGDVEKEFNIDACRDRWFDIMNEYNVNIEELE